MYDNWYKDAIMYAIDVKLFKDGDGNGFGDFKGLIDQLEYIQNLGITCIWLLPFYPSPLKDYGYDVKDYYAVDPRLGTLGDFTEFLHKAHALGIRVVVDLVVNHTSIEHPWFLSARESKDSPHRDYYVWRKEPPEGGEEKIMFEGFEDSIWEYTEETGEYYLHRFFKEQADLNLSNQNVRDEIMKIIRFWIQLGVDGFRVDAAHVITDPVDIDHVDSGELHLLFEEMRDFMHKLNPRAVLLGEANVNADELDIYFERNRMHMLFNFYTNKYNFLAFARDEGTPLLKGLKMIKDIKLGHWVNFIRHHDELNLEKLDYDERQEVFAVFAPDENMRIFSNKGIRRNLAPMLDNQRNEIELMYAVVFGLPGTPLISYGEEIMMGDDLERYERMSVRIAMHWDNSKNAGFSEAEKEDLYQHPIYEGEFGYQNVNVKDQMKDPASFLNWMGRLIKTRRQYIAFSQGKWEIIPANSEKVAAWYFAYLDRTIMVVANFSGQPIRVKLEPDFKPKKMADIFSDSLYENPENLNELQLNPFGYRWIKVYDKEDIHFVNK